MDEQHEERLSRLGEQLADKAITRRRFVTGALALGVSVSALAPILAACGSDDTSTSGSSSSPNASGNKDVRVLGLSAHFQPQHIEKFKADTGYNLIVTTDTLTGMMTKMLTAPQDYDCINNNSTYLQPMFDAGVVTTIALDKIPNWSTAIPLFTDPKAPGSAFDWPTSQVWQDVNDQKEFKAVPAIYNFEAMGYNADQIASVDSYATLFDAKYKGKTAIWNDAVWTIGMTALYLTKTGQMAAPKTFVGDLSAEEIDTVISFLSKKKSAGQFRAFWSDYGQSVNLLAAQEVWAMDAWAPAMIDAKTQSKLPLKYINPKEGNRPWFHGNAMSTKAKNPDGVIALANWMLEGWYGASIAPLGYFSPATSYEKYITPEDKAFVYDGKGLTNMSQAERVANVAYWPGWPTQYEAYLSKWSAFLAG